MLTSCEISVNNLLSNSPATTIKTILHFKLNCSAVYKVLTRKLAALCFVTIKLEKFMFSWGTIRPDLIKTSLRIFIFWTEKKKKKNLKYLMRETDSKAEVELKCSFWLTAVVSLANQIAPCILTSVAIGWNSVLYQSTNVCWWHFCSFWEQRNPENKDELL